MSERPGADKSVFGDHDAPVLPPSVQHPGPKTQTPKPAFSPRRGGLNAQAAFARAGKQQGWAAFARNWLGDRSFEGLDRDRDGALRGREIERLVVRGGATYDKNDDAAISRREFLAGRNADRRAATKGSKAHAKQQAKLSKRTARGFDLADLDLDGKLRGGERGAYRAYDRNRNGIVSEREFRKGQARDRQAAREQLWLKGRVPKAIAKRLRMDAYGKLKAMPKPQIRLDARRVAAVLGSPVANVRRSLPGIAAALQREGIRDRASFIATLATIRTEVGSFLPIHEYGGPGYWARYNGRTELGNRPGTNDGVVYHGRGFIQLTGRGNYRTYGRAIGVDLVKRPDRALDPRVAARVLVEYFQARGVITRARSGDWDGVRTAVNGGHNGWDTFIGAVNRLKADRSWFRKV